MWAFDVETTLLRARKVLMRCPEVCSQRAQSSLIIINFAVILFNISIKKYALFFTQISASRN
jgi:hypothetical protein